DEVPSPLGRAPQRVERAPDRGPVTIAPPAGEPLELFGLVLGVGALVREPPLVAQALLERRRLGFGIGVHPHPRPLARLDLPKAAGVGRHQLLLHVPERLDRPAPALDPPELLLRPRADPL